MDVDYPRDANNKLEEAMDRLYPEKKEENTTKLSGLSQETSSRVKNATQEGEKAESKANAKNESTNASGNASTPADAGANTTSQNATKCVTRADPRVESWFGKTAPEGTPCVFGVDDRDEGQHCVMEDGLPYGSFGWCWTMEDRSEWGSCGEKCPLVGHAKVLGKKIKRVDKMLRRVQKLLNGSEESAANETNVTDATQANATAAENAAKDVAKKAAKESAKEEAKTAPKEGAAKGAAKVAKKEAGKAAAKEAAKAASLLAHASGWGSFLSR